MADDGETSDPQVTFKVKTSGEGLHTITMAETATVLELKTKLATTEFENIPVERQRLIYSGRVMKNDDTLSTYKIKPGNTLHLVKSAASNHQPTSTAAAASGASPAAAVPTNMAAGTPANNILAGLTGARFAGHAPLPNSDIFGPDGGMQLPTEDQLTEMMANPAIAQSVNEALNNDSFVDLLLQSNPALRDTPHAREMIQSPMFRAMLTDPEHIRMVGRMRRAMGGGQSAFPAPGATDSTPSGAPASDGAAAGQAANPFAGANPFMPLFPGMGANPGAGGNAADMNRFMSMLFPGGAGAAGAAGAPGATAGAATAAAGTTAESGTRAAGEQAGAAAGTGAAPGAAAGAAAGNPFASLFGGGAPGGFQVTPEMMQQAMQMFGGAGGNPFAAAAPSPPDNRPPEERYAEQLRQLNDMGFYDFDQNVAALRRSGGSVQGAIQHLLGD